MADTIAILECAYRHEAEHGSQVFLTQPVGGGRVIDYTWAQVMDEARRMAAYLSGQGFGHGTRIAMLSKNCAHFFIAELAIWMAGGATVAIFPTETAQTVAYVLEHSEAALLFVGKLDDWASQRPGVPANLPCIALPLADAPAMPSWQGIVDAAKPIAGRPVRDDDELAMLVYTSGSTGRPKGVMHSFGGIARSSASINALLNTVHTDGAQRRLISYLPLAHVMERAYIECASIADERPARVFFAESVDTFLDDLRRARPTFFFSVPRLWLKFQQGVFEKVPRRKLDLLLRLPFIGRRVGRRVLEGLGLENARIAGSGSAPVAPAVLQWYQRLGLQVVQGYGMSEDFSCSHVCTREFFDLVSVGRPMLGVESKLGEDGEILVKSPGHMMGYYKQPEMTAESFTAEGFFHTGDLGQFDAEGKLRVTGRLKELFKTSKGKYVAPVPIEMRLNAHPLVEMCIVAGAGREAPHALVQLAADQVGTLGRDQVEQTLGGLLEQVNAELSDYERLRMVVVAREPWTIERGTLTPTLKVKRSVIEQEIAARLDDWYAASGRVVWA